MFEVDCTQDCRAAGQGKGSFAAREGVNLSFLPFFVKAALEAAKAYPVINSTLADDLKETGVLERGINEIVQRHEVLRTVFASLDDEPMQVIKPDMPVHLAIHDLRELAPEEMEAETERLTAEIVQRVFDLAEGPLIRVALLRRGIEDHVFVLVMHHIVSDGWSLGIFWRELSALYNAYYVGQKSPLPELPIQYADFTVWQRGRLTGERLDQLTAYWRHSCRISRCCSFPRTGHGRPRSAIAAHRSPSPCRAP